LLWWFAAATRQYLYLKTASGLFRAVFGEPLKIYHGLSFFFLRAFFFFLSRKKEEKREIFNIKNIF